MFYLCHQHGLICSLFLAFLNRFHTTIHTSHFFYQTHNSSVRIFYHFQNKRFVLHLLFLFCTFCWCLEHNGKHTSVFRLYTKPCCLRSRRFYTLFPIFYFLFHSILSIFHTWHPLCNCQRFECLHFCNTLNIYHLVWCNNH